MKFRAALFLFILLFSNAAAALQAEGVTDPAPDYRRLPDLYVFADWPNGQWAGSGNGMVLETAGPTSLPVDETETHHDLPSYRVSVSGENGWWSFILAGPDWEAYSIAPYYPDGALEFNIKGAAGQEDFNVALSDNMIGRQPQNLTTAQVQISSLVQVTTEWQPVRIPLQSLLAATPGFNMEQMFTVEFSAVSGAPLTFWLNEIRFTSAAEEPGYPAIKLNQLGYVPAAPKFAHVSGFEEELLAGEGTPFEIRDIRNNQPVFQGELELLTPFDPVVSGERILAADFSDLTTPGQYYLAVDAYRMAGSPPFTIAENIYDPLLADALHYFYLQRSGMPLEAEYAGLFARDAGHPQDERAEFRSGAHLPRDVAGGWYDAGDYGKYVNAGATAVSDLLWAYEMFPDRFPDGHVNIPEGGNGVPDLLDEVRWELDWILKMQDPNSGGFYHMVQPTEETTIPLARGVRYIEDTDGVRADVRPTSTTGSAAAALAHAALVYRAFAPDYAAELLAAAERGWSYLVANPEGVAPLPGPYSDGGDADDRFWAAAALFRATGDPVYEDYLTLVYQEIDTFFTSENDNAYGVGVMEMIGWLHIAHTAEIDPALSTAFEQLYDPWAARMVARWQASPWRLTLLDEDFYWGSNNVVLTTPLVMLVGGRALDRPAEPVRTIARQGLDYLLGTNPLSFSYVSGYGENRLEHPLSQQWSRDGIVDVPSGVLAGGPNAYTNQLFYSNFAGKRYVDGAASWTVNEHTIYWNSTLVFHAALAAEAGREAAPSGVVTPLPTAEPPARPAEAAEAAVATVVVEVTSTPLPTIPPEPEPTAAAVAAAEPAVAVDQAPAGREPDSLLLGLQVVNLAWLALLSVAVLLIWRAGRRRG